MESCPEAQGSEGTALLLFRVLTWSGEVTFLRPGQGLAATKRDKDHYLCGE